MSSSHRTRSTKEPAVEKQDKFPVLTMSPFKIMALPKLRGVAGLSLIEIKDDLKELIPPSDDNDTDSDCSLLSEDILDSVYPVAPRSAPRTAGNSSLPDYTSSGNNGSNDEAMYFINDISKTHKEIYENEKYREEMEIQCEAYDANLEMEKNVFSNSRKEYESYLKLVQGLYARNVRLHSAYSRQNSLLHHLHCNLQDQKATEQMVQAETNKLRSFISSAKAKQNGKTAPAVATGTSEDPASVNDGSVGILRVHLQKSAVEVILHRGMTIPTPIGDGEIASIYPERSKLAIKLPYGIMHAHLPRAVGWLQTALPAVNEKNMLASTSSVHGVQQIYRERLHTRLTVPHRQAKEIQALLAQQRGGEDDTGAMTDHDDASGDESSELEATGSADPSLSEHPQSQDNNGAAAMEIEGTDSAETAAGRNNSRRSGGEPVPSFTTVAATTTADHIPVFPLPCASTGPSARAVAKRDLEAALQEKYSQLLLHTLPLAFAPPASLPHVVDQLNSYSKSQHNPLCQGDIEFELHALQRLYSSYPAHLLRTQESVTVEDACGDHDGATEAGIGQPGATGSLAWHGDVKDLKSSLKMVHEQIRELEFEQQQRISEIEHARRICSNLTTSATTIRLNMFTRRLAHRTNLSNRGIVLPTAAPAPAQSGKARNQANSARNSANNINSLLGAATSEGVGTGMALLLAAGESRSSRSKRSSASLKSESSAVNQQNADGLDGFVRKAQMLRSSAESPFSTTHSVQDEAPSTGERPPVNSRRRATAATVAGVAAVKDEVAVGNKRRAVSTSSSRRANEDIVASAGEVDQQVGGGGTADEGTVADSDSGASTSRQTRGDTTAAVGQAKKKTKRRRY